MEILMGLFLIYSNNFGPKAQIKEDSVGSEAIWVICRGGEGTEFQEKQSLEIKRAADFMILPGYLPKIDLFWEATWHPQPASWRRQLGVEVFRLTFHS